MQRGEKMPPRFSPKNQFKDEERNSTREGTRSLGSGAGMEPVWIRSEPEPQGCTSNRTSLKSWPKPKRLQLHQALKPAPH